MDKDLSFDLIVFCPLRWEFVLQRPQHLISHMAKKHKVLFVEEPIKFDKSNKGSANVLQINDHLTIIQPRIELSNLVQELVPIVDNYTEILSIQNPVLWFYSPLCISIAKDISYSLQVFDLTHIINPKDESLSQMDLVFVDNQKYYNSEILKDKTVSILPIFESDFIDDKYWHNMAQTAERAIIQKLAINSHRVSKSSLFKPSRLDIGL